MYDKIEKKYNDKRQELIKFATRRVHGNCEYLAEECVNETFTKLCEAENKSGYLEEEFDSLIYRILFNAIYDCNEQEIMGGMTGRKNKRHSYSEVKRLTKDIGDLYNIEDENSDLLRKVAVDLELDKMLDGTKRVQRVLQLFYYDGYTHDQIAWLCHISEKTSRNIVSLHLKGIKEDD